MKHVLIAFLLGLVAGVLGLWAFRPTLLQEGPRQRAVPGPARRAAPGPPPAPAGDGPADPAPLRARMPDDAAAALRRVGFDGPETGVVGHSALAQLFALGGRPEEFLRAVDDALRDGADPDALLQAARLLPADLVAGAIEEMLRLFPDAGWDYTQAADALFVLGLQERGLAVLLAGMQRNGAAHGLVVSWLIADPEGGVARFLPEADGWEAETLASYAEVLLGHDHAALALPFLRIALAKEPRHDESLDLLGQADPAAARVHAERRVHEDENDVEAWRFLGQLRAGAGDVDGAMVAYREMLKRAVDEEALWAVFEVDRERALPIMAEAVRNTGNDEAIGVVAKAYLEAGRNSEAFAEYLRAYARDPSDSEWLHALVQLDANRALEAIGVRVKESPESASDEEVGAYARALLEAGRRSEAFDYYYAALRKDRADSEWTTGLARADPVRAVPVLREMVAKSPNDRSLQGALAVALGGAGQREAALALFREIAAPDEGLLWYREMARIAPVEALGRLRDALEEQPENDELWGALTKAYMDLGRTAEALDALRTARELDPGDTEWRVLDSKLR